MNTNFSETEFHSTFWEHTEELRSVLIRCFLVFTIGFIFSLCMFEQISSLLAFPLNKSTTSGLQRQIFKKERVQNLSSVNVTYQYPSSYISSFLSAGTEEIQTGVFKIPPGGYLDIESLAQKEKPLILLSPLDGMAMTLQVSVWSGFVVSSPFLILFFMQFISPALTIKEKGLLIPFVSISFLAISLGCCIALYTIIPLSNSYLFGFNQSLGKNFWTLPSYLNYTFTLMLACSLLLEITAILFLLVHFQIFSVKSMIEKRKTIIFSAFILGALLTPPDILTQLIFAIPMIILYECAILYSKFRKISYFAKT